MDFQMPDFICEYMVSLLPDIRNISRVLEPTPGEGNLVRTLEKWHLDVTIPENDFWNMEPGRYDAVVMNPPFTPMRKGYDILYQCMEMADVIIALMPWLVIINSEKRTKDIMDFGLRSVTHLPRWVFNGARVQTCILSMNKGYHGKTEFIVF